MPEPFILLPDDLTYHKPNKTEHFITTSLATQAFLLATQLMTGHDLEQMQNTVKSSCYAHNMLSISPFSRLTSQVCNEV